MPDREVSLDVSRKIVDHIEDNGGHLIAGQLEEGGPSREVVNQYSIYKFKGDPLVIYGFGGGTRHVLCSDIQESALRTARIDLNPNSRPTTIERGNFD